MKQLLFKTKIDTSLKGFCPPFFASSVLLITGGVLVYFSLYDNPVTKANMRIWAYALVASLILESLFWAWYLPKEELRLYEKAGQLYLEIWKEGDFWDYIKIDQIQHWWNYDFAQSNLPLALKSNKHGSKSENNIFLYLTILSDQNQILHLKEKEAFWKPFLNGWSYRLDTYSEKQEVINAFHLQELINIIQNQSPQFNYPLVIQ